MVIQIILLLLFCVTTSSIGPPIEHALFHELAPNFEEAMTQKMQAHPELERLAEESAKNGSKGPFFLQHLDTFEKYMKEIFIENGNSPGMADFVISILRLGANQQESGKPITPEQRAKAQADFKKKWEVLDEVGKDKVRKSVPTLAAVLEGPRST